MGIKNEEVLVLIKEKFISMEDHYNIIEKELNKDNDDDFNRAKVAMSFGKVYKLYEDITYFMGVFDKNPKYEGR